MPAPGTSPRSVSTPVTPVAVVGVPLDLGVSKLGVDMGPTALRYAGILEALTWAGIPWRDAGDLPVIRNFTLDHLPPAERGSAKLAEIVRVSADLGQFVSSARACGELPIVLGGDHATAIGSVAGAASSVNRLGLLWIDAHPDANTPQTSPSGNIHGMPLAVSLGHGLRQLTHCLGFAPKVRPEDVCIVGAKDIDPDEAAFLRHHGIACFTTFDIQELGLAEVMRRATEIVGQDTDGVHVSFDADVMDMRVAPGTGITTRGGLSYREITYVMRAIAQHLRLVSLDVIEVNPLLDKRNQTAELCVELVMAALGIKYTDYEKRYLRANLPQNGHTGDHD